VQRADEQPLAHLYQSMLQQLGVEATSFATTTGTLRSLEPG